MQVGRQPIAGHSPRVRDDPPEAAVPRPPPAAETTRLYKADWTAFAAWCEATGVAALPAAPATVSWAAVPPPSATSTAGAVSLHRSPIRW